MRLIGAGLPRTATLSQKLALERLGFEPCYHMVDVLADLELVTGWAEAFAGSGRWEEIFAGYQSTVDWPGSYFYRELIEVYPDAKVLLSVRDPDSWAKSVYETIWGVLFGDTLMRDLSMARARVDPGWRHYSEFMRAMWAKAGMPAALDETSLARLANAMTLFNAEVQAVVPKDRLLVWSAAEGWEPLCAFLEVDVPSEPFPRVNDAEMFVERIVDASLTALTDWRTEQTSAATR